MKQKEMGASSTGGPVVKNPPCSAGVPVGSLLWEDPTWLGAAQPVHSCCARPAEPDDLERGPRSEKPVHRSKE